MDSFAATPAPKHLESSRPSPYSSTPSMALSTASTGSIRINSRRKPRTFLPRVTGPTPTSSEFVQPSKVFPGSKHLTPYAVCSSDLTRRQQLQPSAPKVEPAKGAVRRDNQPKPYLLEPPPQALKYPDAGCSDFFPWRGNHDEDKIYDVQARNGQYDKLPVAKSNTEQASARAVFAPALKQRPGLATLSSLFLTILEQRQNSGQMPTTSTFKPPPRIALPDPRREAWLRDLASAHVPLRRLSRTIPHGLKGTVLLEHCLAKEVPVPRAVWLIRCVGANELRGLRRKGVGSLAVGGEARWIREWTVQVSQFLEKILFGSSLPAGGPWHHHILYTIRLVLHLYAESLLDGPVFLDWLISLTQDCPSERLPLVFSAIGPLWEDITKQSKLLNRIARVIHLHSTSYSEPLRPLCIRYWAQYSELFDTHRRGLISGFTGVGASVSPTDLVDLKDLRQLICADNIRSRRNAIGIDKSVLHSADARQSDCRNLLASLDKTPPPYDFSPVWKQFSATLIQDDGIHLVCQWAVTPLRSGIYRIYAAVRLLVTISQSGVDLQEPFLVFLKQCDIRNKALYLLVSEVTRLKIFSIAGYLRWLIASGGLPNSDCAQAQILSQLPTHGVSTKLQNLRRILLRSCGHDVGGEASLVEELKESLSSRGLFPPAPAAATPLLLEDVARLQGLSRYVQSEIGVWIRDKIREKVQGISFDTHGQQWEAPPTNQTPYIEPQQFMLARDVLEAISDLRMLADVIKLVVTSDSCEVLKSVVQTLINNADAFYVLDVLPGAMDIVSERYTILRSRHCLDKPLILSLSELATITSRAKFLDELTRDLGNHDRDYPRSAAAPSPVSESMGDIFDDDGMDGNEEIEHLWVSNVPVDQHNLSRLFETATASIENARDNDDGHTTIISTTQGLVKLRDINLPFFNEAIDRWVLRMRESANNFSFFRSITLLLSGGTLQLETLVSGAVGVGDSQTNNGTENEYSFVSNVLRLILCDNPFEARLSTQEMYSLKTQRLMFLRSKTTSVLGLYRRLIILCSGLDNNLESQTTGLLSSDASLETLRHIAVSSAGVFMSEIVEPLSQPGSPGSRWLVTLIDLILDDTDPADTTGESVHAAQVGRLLTIVNEFNLSICKLKLQLLFGIFSRDTGEKTTRPGRTDQSPCAIAKAVVRGFVSAPQNRHHLCSDLVSLLSPDHARDIFSAAEELVLDPSSFLQAHYVLEKLDLPAADGPEVSEHLAKVLLRVIESTSSTPRNAGLHDIPTSLVDRLSTILQLLDENFAEQSQSSSNGSDRSDVPDEYRSWLLLLLRILIVHRSDFSPSRSATAAYDQARVIFCLCCLLQTEYIRNQPDLLSYISDIATQLGDDLPDEHRAQLRRCTLAHKTPPGTSFLVSNWDSSDNLEVYQRGKLSDYAIKTWERLSEPTPVIGENDTSLSLRLFRARRT
ncbi:hypothetical protein EX30DRAFT_343545 [Ascodesmis nigricans]|uniref:Mediator of RNA polymerase II transcription subunit 12 n=1 Tax=Ascodesmis nigricans TaxID=341454 RepID=A0A4S2MR11_9PEZI|nr:hypothetical protein EX30DRAFT_343545 [Ascodesmis nigricans]